MLGSLTFNLDLNLKINIGVTVKYLQESWHVSRKPLYLLLVNSNRLFPMKTEYQPVHIGPVSDIIQTSDVFASMVTIALLGLRTVDGKLVHPCASPT